MGRIQLSLPERFAYCHELTVRITDLNYGGHMGNERVLAYAQEARAGFLQAHGYSEMDVEGLGIIIADAAVIYRAEVFAGTLLRVHLGLDAFNKYGCDMVYRLENADDASEVARAKTGIVFFDYSVRRIARAPAAFVDRFGSG